MLSALKSGFLYFATVFVVGFALGTVRVLTIVPRVGELVSHLLASQLIARVEVLRRKCSMPCPTLTAR